MKNGRTLVSLAQELERQLNSKKDLVVPSALMRHDTDDTGQTRLVVEETGGHRPAPVTAEQLIEARRPEDIGHSLWTTFQRVQENVIRGGQPGRSAQGRRLQTRPVGSIDRGVSLNRALWMLAEEMRKLKA